MMQPRVQSQESNTILANKFHPVDRCCSRISESNHSAILTTGGETITAAEPSRKRDNS